MSKSWAPEMHVDGGWSKNGLRFATEEEAYRWGADLMMRWFAPSGHRAVESDDPVNYELLADGSIQKVTDGAGSSSD